VTPEQLELVSSTLPRVRARGETFSACFLGRLFASAPETRALFTDTIAGHRASLAAELSCLVEALSDLPAFVVRARDLGARLHAHGVRLDHYEVAEPAVLAGLAVAIGPGWTETTMVAWRRLYRLIVETMLEGAGGAAFAGPAKDGPHAGAAFAGPAEATFSTYGGPSEEAW
jgi:hemoglobin-like flavoprotein